MANYVFIDLEDVIDDYNSLALIEMLRLSDFKKIVGEICRSVEEIEGSSGVTAIAMVEESLMNMAETRDLDFLRKNNINIKTAVIDIFHALRRRTFSETWEFREIRGRTLIYEEY